MPEPSVDEVAPKHSADEGATTPAPSQQAASSRRRLLRDFLRPGRGQMVVALILAVTSALVMLTVRSQEDGVDYSTMRREELVQLLDNLTAETKRLESDIAAQQQTRDDLASGAEGAAAAEAESLRRLSQLQIIGGTIPVHGTGIRVTISDPGAKVTPELLLNALEELRDAGAEVIEFNDTVRVVAATWIASDGAGGISVDGHALSAPIVIDAIGSPATLEAGARFRGGLVSQVEGSSVGGSVAIEQLEDLRIDSVVEQRENVFARPN